MLGREPWSSGLGRRLMFQRFWVRIPAPYTGWIFFTYLFATKIVTFVWKYKNVWKRDREKYFRTWLESAESLWLFIFWKQRSVPFLSSFYFFILLSNYCNQDEKVSIKVENSFLPRNQQNREARPRQKRVWLVEVWKAKTHLRDLGVQCDQIGRFIPLWATF